MNLAELFTEHGIKPVLNQLDMASGGEGRLNTQAAINLILMIIAHESGKFTYSKQIQGPALGFTQMEPETFNWLVEWLGKNRPTLLHALKSFAPVGALEPCYMVISAQFAVAAARLNLLRFSEPLPDADDLDGLARYAKKYWNTSAGKASEQEYRLAYQSVIGEAK